MDIAQGGAMHKDITMRSVTKFLLLLCLLLVGQTALAQSTGTVTYVYTDPQGTPLAEADASGNITATFDYTPYGSTALGTPPNGPGYTGHVNDPETNLVYMQARYYDPATGHFLSTDPIRPVPGDAFKFNRYTYVNNNPILGIDPTGMDDDCGPGCGLMRRLSDWFSSIQQWGSAGGSPKKLLGQTEATTTYMNNEVDGDLATASGAAAPVADMVPGVTVVACLDGEDCGVGDWAGGIFSAVPVEGIEAEGASLIAKGLHGNSALSSRTAYLYRLTTRGGDLLKWGISYNPAKRYSFSAMLGKRMQVMTSGTRREMLDLERWIVERDPGPLNHERWAGDAIKNGTEKNGP
jgi:RHS repeat-associated protein